MFENIWTLVVEDDAHDLVVVIGLLKELGIQYKRNTSGADVIPQAAQMQPPPNFIILDLDLPEGNPFEIKADLMADPALKEIPVIAVGGEQWIALQPYLREGSFAGFVLKPLPRKHFGSIIRDILAGNTAWQENV